MELKDFVKLQIAGSRRLFDAAINETAPEMMNAKVGEHSNTISAVLAHVVGGEDYFINMAIQGKPRRWESEGWGARLGITSQLGRDWAIQISDLAAFREYITAVRASTDAYLETVTPEELDRKVMVFGNERPVANVLALIATHSGGHAGEIATLKGVQGVKGLPF